MYALLPALFQKDLLWYVTDCFKAISHVGAVQYVTDCARHNMLRRGSPGRAASSRYLEM